MRIGIVGTGWVGSSVAISCLHHGVATELLLADVRSEVAEGEAMDLAHGAPFYDAAEVRAVELAEMRACDAVVVAAGRGGGPGQSRLDLLRHNAAIVSDIAGALRPFAGLLVIVTNPVDLMTLIAQRASGLPPARVIGTGTMLDTARLRQMLGHELRLEPRSIHAQVIGEHGDSSVPLWSSAQVGGLPLRHMAGWHAELEPTLTDQVRGAAGEIIRRKGATNHAIGLVTAALLRWALRGSRRVLTISRVQEGAFGHRDLALSLPTIVGPLGAEQVLEPDLTPDERAALDRSADILRQAARSLDSPAPR
jgi:L-lactate dehydrogenase